MSMMNVVARARIVVNARTLRFPLTGVQRYTLELIRLKTCTYAPWG